MVGKLKLDSGKVGGHILSFQIEDFKISITRFFSSSKALKVKYLLHF